MSTRPIPTEAQAIARRLGELFDRDRELAIALNDASSRLQQANDQLTAGLSAEALRAVYGPMGPDLGLSGRKPPVLEDEQPIAALERVAEAIRAAFHDYQQRADDRRVLGFDVGEVNAQLVAAMTAGGFTEQEVRQADVGALAAGQYRPGAQK